MNDFPITYLRNDGQDEPVVAFHDRLLVFQFPVDKESIFIHGLNSAKRIFAGNKLSKLHALSSGVHFNLLRINAYQFCDREVKMFLEDANFLAIQHSNSNITSSHLLIAILMETFVQCFFTKRLEISLVDISHQLASNIAALPNGECTGIDTQLSKIMLKATGIAQERGEEQVRLIDVLAALVGFDSVVEQILRKSGYTENDRENLVAWLKITAGPCVKRRFPKINVIRKLLLWVSPVDFKNPELVMARDTEISHVLQEVSNDHSFVILQAENGVGVDSFIGALNAKYQSMLGVPLIELHVSNISAGASASTLEQRFNLVFAQLKNLKHPALVIRGFEELLGLTGSTGFDFTSVLSKFANQKRVKIIAVLNNNALARLKDTSLYNSAKVIELKPLDINGRIQLILSQLANIEEISMNMISYDAIKSFVEKINDSRPKFLLDRLKSLLPKNNKISVELITKEKMIELLNQAGI